MSVRHNPMASPDNYSRLRDVFSPTGLRWIVERLVARTRAGRPLRGTITLTKASADERRGVDDLLGRKSTAGAHLGIDLADLEQILRDAGLAESLEEVVLACHGRVENSREKSEQQRAAWQAVFANARRQCESQPPLLRWLDALAADGTLKRLSGGDLMEAAGWLDSALRVLTRTGDDPILLANLAAACSGDSHALDRGQPLATLCLRAIAALHGIDGQRGTEARRKAWAALGVVIDDLSAPALVFNLRAAAGSALEDVLEIHREQTQPVFLTYRQLQRANPFRSPDPGMRTVYICENPSIVSAAARELGPRCRPLVCTNGQPASAVRLLLSQLQEAEVSLRCHADFDWAGLRIVEQLVREYAAIPWQMGTADYQSVSGTVALDPQPLASDWSPGLADALRATGKAVFEEQVMESLLRELNPETVRHD